MVVCDVVTHTIAREMGDAFLITSGIEPALAISQAVDISMVPASCGRRTCFYAASRRSRAAGVVSDGAGEQPVL